MGAVNHRHKSNKASDPEWEASAAATAARILHIDDDSRQRLIAQARDLDRSRYWEGLDGLEVTSSMRGHVATRACLLTLNIGLGFLGDVTSILLAPHASIQSMRQQVGGSIVTESDGCVLGQALLHGPVRMSWQQVVAESTLGTGTSVVLHEFAHKIDMADTYPDGNPPMADRHASSLFDSISARVLAELRSGAIRPPLRRYAATNRIELFAVATEGFFLRSTELATYYPDLHEALKGFYRQDPTTVTS